MKLGEKDFNELIEINSHLTAIKRSICEIIECRGVIERMYHNWWTRIRKEHDLDITRNYTIDTQSGKIIEIEKEIDNKVKYNTNLVINKNISFTEWSNDCVHRDSNHCTLLESQSSYPYNCNSENCTLIRGEK